MNDQIQKFLTRIDEWLATRASPGERLDVFHLGRSALVLQFNLPLSTQDFDIVLIRDSPLEETMIEEFGKNTPAAREHGLYIDPVPPVPHWFRKRSKEIQGGWKVLRLWELEVHDLAATKLKSFRTNDRQDLQMLCDLGHLGTEKLRASLEAAYLWSVPGKDDEDDPDRVKAFEHLKQVEAYLAGNREAI